MDHSLLICTEGCLGCFQFWQIWINLLKHPCEGFCVDISFHPLCINSKERYYWIVYTMSKFHFVKKKTSPNCLPKWLHHFAFSPAMNMSSCCFISWTEFGVVSVLSFGHSNKCAVVPHYCFNLLFLGDIWCGTFFHRLICHLTSLVRCLLWSFVLSSLYFSCPNKLF